jgi:hypothetical protein
MRDKWTDERLDEMSERMSDGFNRVDRELRDVRAEIRAFRSDVRAEFGSVQAEFGSVRAEMTNRFDAIQQLILRVSAGMVVTMLIGFIGLVVSQH